MDLKKVLFVSKCHYTNSTQGYLTVEQNVLRRDTSACRDSRGTIINFRMYGVPWSHVIVFLWMQNIKCALLLRIMQWDAVLSVAEHSLFAWEALDQKVYWDVQFYQSLGRRYLLLVTSPRATPPPPPTRTLKGSLFATVKLLSSGLLLHNSYA